MRTIPKGTNGQSTPGYWCIVEDDPEWRYITFSCPDCGGLGNIGNLSQAKFGSGHKVAPDGTVTPSVVCPYDECGFHDHVRLADWAAA